MAAIRAGYSCSKGRENDYIVRVFLEDVLESFAYYACHCKDTRDDNAVRMRQVYLQYTRDSDLKTETKENDIYETYLRFKRLGKLLWMRVYPGSKDYGNEVGY